MGCLLVRYINLKFGHLDGNYCTFITLIAHLATTTVASLVEGVGGQQTIDDRYLALGIELCDTGGHTLADVVEVRCLAADDAT